MKRLALFLLLSAAARADISVFSVYPGDMTIRYGERDTNIGTMAAVTLPASDKLEVIVLDDKGAQIYKGSVANNRFLVLCPGKNGQAILTDAGALNAGNQQPEKSIGFFNATGFPIRLDLFPAIGDDGIELELKLGSNDLVGPYELPEGKFKINVRDEGGNPIGKSYSDVYAGKFYLIYRKRQTLYDLEKLGIVMTPAKTVR